MTPGGSAGFLERPAIIEGSGAFRKSVATSRIDAARNEVVLAPRKVFGMLRPFRLSIVGSPTLGLEDACSPLIDDEDVKTGGNRVARSKAADH